MAWEEFKYAKTETTLPALILVVDELAQFLDDQPRELQRKVDQFQGNIQKIARLGRASHIHVLLATQSCTASLFPPSLKNNIAFRNVCGRVEANISRMAIDSDEAESLPLTPGSYLGYSKGETLPYQGFYLKTDEVVSLGTVRSDWVDDSLINDDDDEDEFVVESIVETEKVDLDNNPSDLSNDEDNEEIKNILNNCDDNEDGDEEEIINDNDDDELSIKNLKINKLSIKLNKSDVVVSEKKDEFVSNSRRGRITIE